MKASNKFISQLMQVSMTDGLPKHAFIYIKYPDLNAVNLHTWTILPFSLIRVQFDGGYSSNAITSFINNETLQRASDEKYKALEEKKIDTLF